MNGAFYGVLVVACAGLVFTILYLRHMAVNCSLRRDLDYRVTQYRLLIDRHHPSFGEDDHVRIRSALKAIESGSVKDGLYWLGYLRAMVEAAGIEEPLPWVRPY